MTQNRSHAVMAQRHEAHDSLDDFPTPPWATRALIEHVLIGGGWRRDNLAGMTCREPAANRGYMARPLAEYFAAVDASDVHDYGAGYPVRDFLFRYTLKPVDWTIVNPPFKLAEEFVYRALETSKIGVAIFVRASFIEGIERYTQLFSKFKPTFFSPFAERVLLVKGRMLDPDRPYQDTDTGEMKRPTTATAYAWFVWSHETYHAFRPWEVKIIPPCRKQLTRAGDYPEAA